MAKKSAAGAFYDALIAGGLYEAAIRAKLPARHKDVIHAILRLTFGYGRTQDRIAVSQITALTGVSTRHLRPILSDLEAAGVLARGDAPRGRARVIAIQSDPSRWTCGIRTTPADGSPLHGSPAGGSPGTLSSLSGIQEEEEQREGGSRRRESPRRDSLDPHAFLDCVPKAWPGEGKVAWLVENLPHIEDLVDAEGCAGNRHAAIRVKVRAFARVERKPPRRVRPTETGREVDVPPAPDPIGEAALAGYRELRKQLGRIPRPGEIVAFLRQEGRATEAEWWEANSGQAAKGGRNG